jgi:hypothetical protein
VFHFTVYQCESVLLAPLVSLSYGMICIPSPRNADAFMHTGQDVQQGKRQGRVPFSSSSPIFEYLNADWRAGIQRVLIEHADCKIEGLDRPML